MKTKSGRSHWKCTVKRVYASRGTETQELFFTAFDGVKHMETLKNRYIAHGVHFDYTNLVNLDAE